MTDHDGRSALISGGAGQVGAAIAKALSEEGFGVLIGDLLEGEGNATASKLGDRVAFQRLDVTQPESWESAIDTAESTYGHLSVLVNNAGIIEPGSVQLQRPTQFKHVLNTNLYGAWLGIHCAAQFLTAAGGGAIVNISSAAGLTGYQGMGAYVASEWGLRGLTKAAALDLCGNNVRVCSVHPGPIQGSATNDFGGLPFVSDQPIPRLGSPNEIASTVRFIVSEATYSTGTEFVVDGGYSAGRQRS
ncbi:SDR family oxidoreductase [Rhodococcus baikonurensis]|uniref:SDR family oxidoreductase n=1 Tax=Rhodococcus baikonurensis TaxID=172041 RepID=A0ABV5X7U2_9NOCA